MRLVSTVELMVIREKVHNRLGPLENVISDETFIILREADRDFRAWFEQWDHQFSQKYSDVSSYIAVILRGSLILCVYQTLGWVLSPELADSTDICRTISQCYRIARHQPPGGCHQYASSSEADCCSFNPYRKNGIADLVERVCIS